jgi:hypothetical protein
VGRREFIKIKYDMIQDKLSEISKKYWVDSSIKVVGNIDRYIKIMYNGDLSNFYKKSNLLPYKLSDDKMTFYIDDLIVQMHGFKDDNLLPFKNSKKLGDFTYGSKNYISYKFSAEIYPHLMNGQKVWRVVGTSGDSGFGHWFITKKNTLGVRYRTQIYKQIIERFKLNDYLK